MAWAGLVLTLGSTLLQSGGQAAQADQAEIVARQETAQLEQRAGQERAAGQHNAAKMREEARRLMSRQRAGLANSGFDATDRTAETIVSDTAGVAGLEEMLELAQAEERGRYNDYAATIRRRGGKQAKRAGYTQAGGTLLSGLFDASQQVNWGRGNAVVAA